MDSNNTLSSTEKCEQSNKGDDKPKKNYDQNVDGIYMDEALTKSSE